MYEVRENVLCTPSMNCEYNDGFQLFQLQGIDNTSGCEGYGDFTSQSTDLEQGSEYELTVTTGYGDQYIKVWIDYNQNGVFEEPAEIALAHFQPLPANGVYNFTSTETISIPASATLGATRMRIAMSRTEFADPCTPFGNGEVEDYTVTIGMGNTGSNFEVICPRC